MDMCKHWIISLRPLIGRARASAVLPPLRRQVVAPDDPLAAGVRTQRQASRKWRITSSQLTLR